MMRRVWIWLSVLLLLLVATPARAGFVVSIGDASVPRGGTGTLDVWLSSTASSSSPDLLNNLAFTLQIGGPNELKFSSSQSFSYLSSGQYIFAGDSTDQTTSSPGGTVAQTVYPNDTFVGNDSTNSGNPVSLSTANTPVLLAALTLDTTITSLGDKYSISLVPSSGNGSMEGSSQTFFDVFDFSTGLETSAVPFTSMAGTVTITGASVPEPSSLVSGFAGFVILALMHGAKRYSLKRTVRSHAERVHSTWLSPVFVVCACRGRRKFNPLSEKTADQAGGAGDRRQRMAGAYS
jgi:hypothetical protein